MREGILRGRRKLDGSLGEADSVVLTGQSLNVDAGLIMH